MQQLAVNGFRELFQGNNNTYGHHQYGEFTDGKKEDGGKSWTVKDKLITEEAYKNHLTGQLGLGIIPINNENKCKFIAVDIDIYDKRNEQIVIDAINKRDLPFAVFFSKSRGYHLYLFFKEFIPVKKAKSILDKLIRLMSIDILCSDGKRNIEIFPKQVVLSEGQKGNWINIPYYKGNDSRQKMYYDSRELDLDEALVIINTKKLWTIQTITDYLDNLYFNDAPPCLQSIHYLDFLDSSRNNFLFSFGVYFKKVNEDNFERALYDLNRTMVKPLSDEELEKTIIASIRKKGYGYKCKEDPCVQYCNKTECRKRKYGIGDGGYVTELDFGQMQQVCTEPPYYEWEINDKMIRFRSEDDILNQAIFRKLCMRQLHYAPYKLKDPEWIKIINNSLATVKVIKVDIHEDISPGAMLRNFFNEFVLERPMASSKDQLLQGRVYKDTKHKRYLFRSKDLIDFLYVQKQFRHYTQTEVHGFLKDINAGYTKTTTEAGKQVRLFEIAYAYFDSIQEDIEKETPVINFKPDEIIDQAEEMY